MTDQDGYLAELVNWRAHVTAALEAEEPTKFWDVPRLIRELRASLAACQHAQAEAERRLTTHCACEIDREGHFVVECVAHQEVRAARDEQIERRKIQEARVDEWVEICERTDAEVAALRQQVEEQAPSWWSYEQACKALEAQHQRAMAAERQLAEMTAQQARVRDDIRSWKDAEPGSESLSELFDKWIALLDAPPAATGDAT